MKIQLSLEEITEIVKIHLQAMLDINHLYDTNMEIEFQYFNEEGITHMIVRKENNSGP